MSQHFPSPDSSSPAAAPAKPKTSTGVKVLIGCGLTGMIGFCCIGMGSAVGIPAFMRYVKQSKSAEAPIMLAELRESVRARCAEGLPAVSAGPVPMTPSADKQLGDYLSDPGFAALRFAPTDWLYFSYSVVVGADGSSLVVAEGDLDSDGERSRYTLQCTAACECGDIAIERELE